ncbi:hypothetical protein GOB93_14190 [Acetobacter musti]|uniref:HTH cro/C1-type domain-containing protein n=1 Tax=Acetobacter musti TaxID=864732 RepID=A0ABX0JSJ3_9PROT|nr:hypothetical protein [Acetobacter musti]NHN85782.1 hypothetical protein [Acetobacter musti]
MNSPISFDSMRKVLRYDVAGSGGQSAWAQKHGICVSTVCEILNNKREPTEAVINALGYVVRPMCFPVKEGAKVCTRSECDR